MSAGLFFPLFFFPVGSHSLVNPCGGLRSLADWPAVMAVNFRLVPLVHRAVVSGGAGALWNVYLCGQANKDEAEDEEEGSVAAASTPFVATGMDVAPPA